MSFNNWIFHEFLASCSLLQFFTTKVRHILGSWLIRLQYDKRSMNKRRIGMMMLYSGEENYRISFHSTLVLEVWSRPHSRMNLIYPVKNEGVFFIHCLTYTLWRHELWRTPKNCLQLQIFLIDLDAMYLAISLKDREI